MGCRRSLRGREPGAVGFSPRRPRRGRLVPRSCRWPTGEPRSALSSACLAELRSGCSLPGPLPGEPTRTGPNVAGPSRSKPLPGEPHAPSRGEPGGGGLPGVAGAETAMGRACGHPTGVGRWRFPSPARRGDAPGGAGPVMPLPSNRSHPEPATRRDPAIGTTGPSAAPRPGPGHPRRPCPTPTRPDEPRAPRPGPTCPHSLRGRTKPKPWTSGRTAGRESVAREVGCSGGLVTVKATGCHHGPVTLSRSPLTAPPPQRASAHATWPEPTPTPPKPFPSTPHGRIRPPPSAIPPSPTPPSSFGRARIQPTPSLSVRRSGRVAVTRDVVLLRFRFRPRDPLRQPPRR